MGSRPRIERIRLLQENSFYEILGEPLWLNDKEREIFLRLRTAVEKALAPQDLFDFQNVADIACSIVENQRFKRAQVALINSPAVLADLLKLAFGDNPDKARQVALNYFGNDPKKAAAAAALVAQAGMTHLQIEGHAIVAQSDRLQSLDRLVQFREASNDRRIKELKKRQKKRADKIEREKAAQNANASHRQNDRVKVMEDRPRHPRIVSSHGD
jgi:hypothetical protein